MLFPFQGLRRVSIPMEGLLVSPVLHCVHDRLFQLFKLISVFNQPRCPAVC